MGASHSKKKKVEPVAPRPVIKAPPDTLDAHFSATSSQRRMEAVHDLTRLTLRPEPKEKKVKEIDPNGKEATSDYKKKLFMKNTLGWYYYLPASMRPQPKLSAAVAAAEHDEADDVPAGATKKRNMMMLCEMCATGNWPQAQALIDLVGLSVNEPDDEGELPLCAAAANGHHTLVLKLYRDYRVNLMQRRPEDGATALIAAAEAREIRSVEAILQCATLLPVRLAYDHLHMKDTDDDLTAREHAVKSGSNAIVQAIDAHEKHCLNRPATCRHACGLSITFGQQHQHENNECPMYTCVCANGCGARVRRSYMDLHQGYECPKRIRVPSPR